VAGAIAVAAAVLLPLLGRKALADWDEAIYAEVAREFLGRGWLVPHWQFQPWFEKPPLGMWITAIFFRLFGVSEFWARACSALASVGLVAFIHAVALRLRGLTAAWISTVILLTCFGFLRVARLGELDALLALGCCAALWGLDKVQRGDLAGWYWFWTGFAVAVMTKGAASVTLLLTGTVVFLWNRWGWRQFGRQFVMGAGIFALLVLPWHLAMVHLFGGAFLREYLGLHVITRATTYMEGHTTPWWFYGKVLLAYTSPWLILFPFALWRAARRQELRVWFVFALAVLLFFTVVATRSPKYIFPAYPALALVTADWLAELLEKRSRRFAVGAALAAVAAFATASALTRHLRQSLTATKNHQGAELHADHEAPELWRAAIEAPGMSAVAPPVLLWREGVIEQLPSLLFTMRRPLQQVYLVNAPDTLESAKRYANPQPLASWVSATPRLIVLEKRFVAEIPANMEWRPIVEGGTLAIGTIALKQPGEN
jgi:4-amino-4-deoxy-L-arabinose transferase-like glycosyltransferase